MDTGRQTNKGAHSGRGGGQGDCG